MIEVTKYGKKAYLSVMDDDKTMQEILVKLVSDQKEMLSVDSRKPSSDEIFRTSALRLRKFRQFLSTENLKKQVDIALQNS